MRSLILLLVWLGLVLVVLAQPAMAQKAKATGAGSLFAANCAQCHGPDGAGETEMGRSLHAANLRSPEVQKMADQDLTSAIANGKGAMPPFSGQLSTAQIRSLVAYVRTLAKTKTAGKSK